MLIRVALLASMLGLVACQSSPQMDELRSRNQELEQSPACAVESGKHFPPASSQIRFQAFRMTIPALTLSTDARVDSTTMLAAMIPFPPMA
jgi:hypothetical protein